MPDQHKSHIYGIDLLRFFAAFAVLLYHFRTFGAEEKLQNAAYDDRAFQFMGDFGALGWIGVQFFFVLSGYVIARSTTSGDWKCFLQKRALRILPALWICATVALVVRVFGSGEFLDRFMDWVRSVVLSPAGPYIDGVIWTLTIEMIYYALIAVVLFTNSDKKSLRSRLDTVAFILGLTSAVFLLTRFSTEQLEVSWADVLKHYEWTVLLMNHGVMFACGMLLSRLDQGNASWVTKAAIVVFLSASVMQISIVAETLEASISAATIFLISVGLLTSSPKYSAWLYNRTTWLPHKMLGRISYPLYLCHFAVGMELAPSFLSFFGSPPLTFVMLVAFILAYAFLVSEFLEPRLRNAFKKLLASRFQSRKIGT